MKSINKKISKSPEYLYLNIYKKTNEFTISHYHSSRIEADEAAKNRVDRVSCLRVEFRTGEYDSDESFFLNINQFRDSFTLSQELHTDRASADSVKTKSSKRIACVRVPLVEGRYDP